ncbi:MAG: N-acetylmuramoyl-L-alanine amidase [Bacillota bacterium]|nr:N-acetylmuramoyl-L-alanine amidase [Bacillota bacterium]
MLGSIAKIPLTDIERVEIYVDTAKKGMAAVKQETGCTHIMNLGLYNMSTFKPVGYLTVGRKVLSTGGDPYGYAFDGAKITFSYGNNVGAPYFIGSYPHLIREGKIVPFSTPAALGGDRGRSAIGLTADSLVLRCVPDVAGAADYTLKELAADMLSAGCLNAINVDGGGSSQCDFDGETVTSSRKVHNYICVWARKGEYMPKVVLDAGHGVETAGKCAPDGSYYEHEFALDMAYRIKAILERHGVEVTLTRTDEHLLAATDNLCLKKRVEIANAIKDLNLFVSLHSNASGSTWSTAAGFCVYTSAASDSAGRNKAAKAIIARAQEAGITMRSSALVHEMYYVLRYTNAPAVLIEHGFHTSKAEVALLKTASYRNTLAMVDAKGILDYLGIAWVPDASHWAEVYLDSLAAKGIVTEPDKHRADLDGAFTKGEILAMLDRM